MSPQQLAAMALAARKAAGTIQRYYRGYKARKATRTKRKTFKRQPISGLPKARIGAFRGSFGKKGPKPKPVKGVQMKTNYMSTVSQTTTAYYGSPIANREDVLLTYCMFLAQRIAKRSGAVISSWTSLLTWTGHNDGRLSKVLLKFSKTHPDGTSGTADANIVPASNWTWQTLAVSLRNSMVGRAKEGYYPFTMKCFDTDSDVFYEHNRLDQDVVTCHMTMVSKLQNVTPADDGTDMNINAADANPLMGRVYDFSHSAPRLAEGFQREMEAVVDGQGDNVFGGIGEISNVRTDVRQFDTTKLRNYKTALLTNAFVQPPRGAAVFSNCIGAKDIKMPPGGFYTVYRKKKIVASVKRFIAGCVDFEDGSPYNPGIMNINPANVTTSFMVGLRPQIRTTINEVVKIATQTDGVITTSVKRAFSKNAPVYNQLS